MEDDMSNFSRSRRKFITNTSAIAATAVSGLTPQILSAAGHKSLNLRLHRDIQILDPGYMIGGAEGTTEKAIMPTLLHVRAGDTWEWEPSTAVESLGYTDPTHIAFKLKPGLMWDGGYGEFTAEEIREGTGTPVTSISDTLFASAERDKALQGIRHVNEIGYEMLAKAVANRITSDQQKSQSGVTH